MKNSRTAWIIFRRILLLLFIFYIIIYFQAETGINNELTKKTIRTAENIKKFEEDIKNSEYIDLKEYSSQQYIDTSNIISNAGYRISEKGSKLVGNELVKIFNFIKKLFS